jgi:hypothetical protein
MTRQNLLERRPNELQERVDQDADWRGWFATLAADIAQRGAQDRFVVLSVDPSVLTVQGFNNVHAIRAFEWPLEIGKRESENELLLRLTNLAGFLLENAQGRKLRKQKVFISHAKLDGADDAERIKQRLDNTNFGIEPFVDAYDLTPGELFTAELEDEIAHQNPISFAGGTHRDPKRPALSEQRDAKRARGAIRSALKAGREDLAWCADHERQCSHHNC